MIFLELFLTFFKIGAFTFGGGYAMIPLIQSEMLSHGWMTNEDLIDFIAISESTPGPIAINMATFIGNKLGGLLGGFLATLGVVLPSFVIIIIIAKVFDKFRSSKTGKGYMTGLKPAVIGLIASALVSIGKTVFFANGLTFDVFTTSAFYVSLATFAAMSVLAFKKVSPIIIICISAVIGIAAGYLGLL